MGKGARGVREGALPLPQVDCRLGLRQGSVPATRPARQMSDTWLRRLVVLAITLLIVHQIGAWIYSAFGISAGILAVALVAAVSFFGARMAAGGGRNTAWVSCARAAFYSAPFGSEVMDFPERRQELVGSIGGVCTVRNWVRRTSASAAVGVRRAAKSHDPQFAPGRTAISRARV